MVEHHVSHHFYAYSRGPVLVVNSNANSPLEFFDLDSHPFPLGVTICNIFEPKDCIEIDEYPKITILLKFGQAKIYTIAKTKWKPNLLLLIVLGAGFKLFIN